MSDAVMSAGVDPTRLTTMIARERQHFAARHPRCREQHERAQAHWLNGVPMHWMSDWGLPFPLAVAHASGATLSDCDGYTYADFCLGDTGAMFGHSPEPVASALRERAPRGLTYMLPTDETAAVGELLAARFGLPCWQLTQTATDANRAVIRWARAITGRERILVFDGAYHGAVDDTFVRLSHERVIPRPGQIGQVIDYARHARVVEFNDLASLARELEHRDVAVVLAEPVMTNAGMVLPDPEFWPEARRLCERTGTVLALDETHTLSSGPAGHAHRLGLRADFLTLGKAIAGGVPCGAFGFTREMQSRMVDVIGRKPAGHSGLGTTLAANALATSALRASLEHVMTHAAYEHMTELADQLAKGLRKVITAHRLPWHVVQVGARVEFNFRPTPARTARQSLAASIQTLEHGIHLWLLNRGVLITPFHNMMLVSPATSPEDLQRLLRAFDDCCAELIA